MPDPTFRTGARIPFPGASWNQTADVLGRAPDAIQYRAARLFDYGGGPAPRGSWGLAIGNYAVPQYDCWDHVNGKPSDLAPNTIRRVFQSTWAQQLFGQGGAFTGIRVGEWIPWNNAWTFSPPDDPLYPNNDRLVNVLNVPTIKLVTSGPKKGTFATDPKGNVLFDYSSCADPQTQRNMGFFAPYDMEWNGSDFWGINSRNGFYQTAPGSKLICAAAGLTVGQFGTGWEKRNYPPERGSGMPKLMGQVLMEEILDGAIEHAMNLTFVNTMWFPKKGPQGGVEGIHFVGPATRAERLEGTLTMHSPGVVSDSDPDHQTPHGTRVHLVDSYDIDRGIDITRRRLISVGFPSSFVEPLCKSGKVVLVCAAKYGWICSETGNWGMHTETNGRTTTVTDAQAVRCGFGTTKPERAAASSVVASTFTAADLEVVNPSKPGR